MKPSVYDYYCQLRVPVPGGAARTIYEIWEEGSAFNDSVTPSTYCNDYRNHMVLKISSLCAGRGRVFSIGCGNAFVEADLLSRGLHVQAIDCNAQAVELAASKGVEAFIADYFTLPEGHLATFDAVYADGLLGHVYRPEQGLDAFFETMRALRPRPGGWLIFSNDAPLERGFDVTPHGRVSDFWLLSKEYLAETLIRFGFDAWESYHFPYVRPISGPRNRTICVGRVANDARLSS